MAGTMDIPPTLVSSALWGKSVGAKLTTTYEEESDTVKAYYDEEEEEKVLIKSPHPTWTKPLHNFTLGEIVYVWHRFVYADGNLDLRPLGDRDFKKPDWWDGYDRIEDLVNFEELNEEAVSWALKRGIAPGQLFLVACDAPEVTGGSYYEPNDCDVYFHWDVVRVLPCRSPGRAWESFLFRQRLDEQRAERFQAHLLRKDLERTHRWKTDLYIDQTEIRLRLICDGSSRVLVQVQADYDFSKYVWSDTSPLSKERTDAVYAQAFWKLVDRFRELYPGSDLAPLLRLAGDRVEVTRWHQLLLG